MARFGDSSCTGNGSSGRVRRPGWPTQRLLGRADRPVARLRPLVPAFRAADGGGAGGPAAAGPADRRPRAGRRTRRSRPAHRAAGEGSGPGAARQAEGGRGRTGRRDPAARHRTARFWRRRTPPSPGGRTTPSASRPPDRPCCLRSPRAPSPDRRQSRRRGRRTLDHPRRPAVTTEVWLVNALHGIRPIHAWAAPPSTPSPTPKPLPGNPTWKPSPPAFPDSLPPRDPSGAVLQM